MEIVTVSFGVRLALTGIIFLWLATFPGFRASAYQKIAILISGAMATLGVLICIWSV
jgi:hypothetical protein